MTTDRKKTSSLKLQELEAVYAISRAVAGASSTDSALDELVKLLRPAFIFDNIVVYTLAKNQALEPTYARAIGRGRFREADLAWGERTAQEAYTTQEMIHHVEELEIHSNGDRTDVRHFLGLPLIYGDRILGALIFIRFGGPIYTPDQIHLVEHVSISVAQLLQHHHLVKQITNLEAKRQLDSLQDDFVATISHELLTPLGFIKGYATTLLREDTDWDIKTQREFLTIIDEESDRLRELIDNLMDSSRLQTGTLKMTFQPVKLDPLMKDITLRSKSLFDDLQIKVVTKNPGLLIQADPTRLAQVLDNILNNAVKYAPGSPITITIDQIENRACITIQDYGPGIPPEHLNQIFQRFYRVPDKNTAVRGTGLGLYICRRIIQAHNGEIEARSIVGEGTIFYIYIPINPQT